MTDVTGMTDVKVKIINVLQNSTNGHYSVKVKPQEFDGEGKLVDEGVEEIHGIEGLALSRLYGDDVDESVRQWLGAVKAKVIANHQRRKSVSGALAGMVGKHI